MRKRRNRRGPSRTGAAAAGLLSLVLLLLTTPGTIQASWTEPQGTFEAYWSVSGTIHILELQDGELGAAGGHTGTIVVQTNQGTVPSFETDCIAFADPEGSVGRCVWTSTFGDLIYVNLKGSGTAGFGATRGTFVGGTGKFQGIQGGFQFEWNYNVSSGKDATLDGYTMRMTGRYRRD